MGRSLRRWAGRVTSHGIHLITGKHDPFYGVSIAVELEREAGRYVDVLYRDTEDAEWLGHSLVRMALAARRHNIEGAASRFRLSGGETDVHTEHCCDRHGCKYSAEIACSVVLGNKPQSFLCEECEHEAKEADAAAKEVLRMRNERARYRREAKEK